MKLPRIRFLLADDPGEGKTIMAGLLLKELKARGLVTQPHEAARGTIGDRPRGLSHHVRSRPQPTIVA